MATQTNVKVTTHRTEYRGVAPFSSLKAWTLGREESSHIEPRRKSWTVAREYLTDCSGARDDTADMLRRYRGLTLDKRNVKVVVVPDRPGSVYGTAFVIEELPRR